MGSRERITSDFFSSFKSHKPDHPFRAIMSAMDTWLMSVSSVVKLKPVKVDNGGLFPSTNFRRTPWTAAGSINVWLYSFSECRLPKLVPAKRHIPRCCLWNNWQQQNHHPLKQRGDLGTLVHELAGVLLEHDTCWERWYDFSIKSEGLYIESSVAPVISAPDILLPKCDKRVENNLMKVEILGTTWAFRYVDDFLLLSTKPPVPGEEYFCQSV